MTRVISHQLLRTYNNMYQVSIDLVSYGLLGEYIFHDQTYEYASYPILLKRVREYVTSNKLTCYVSIWSNDHSEINNTLHYIN